MICFFDCETTGLPKNWKAPMSNLENWPRVIQLAWLITGYDGKEITRQKHLIKPNGWVMPTDKFWVEHAFSQQDSILNGKPIIEVLNNFISDLQQCFILVSHNMEFDHKVVGAEMIRHGLNTERKPLKICTKEEGTSVCKIPGNYGRWKWPKLSELHQFLFGKDFDDAHDALGDVIACKDCFFEMVRLQHIMISKPAVVA